MKILLAVLFFFIMSCNNNNKKENASMPGAYTMISQSMKTDKRDTTYTSRQQLKIYTEDHMMYAFFSPRDSVGGFGIGTYTADEDTVTENVIYNAADSVKSDTMETYKLVIEKTGKGYKQIIPDIMSQGEHIKLTEEYELADTAKKSPLDGAWKETKSYYISGKDTTSGPNTQYKMYYAGHVIWGQTYTDSAHKSYTGIGFGKFEMNGPNKVKESITASTYYQVRGHDFDVDVEMNGADEFTQTITDKDGNKQVEVYQRLKK